jgi:ABC-type Fe3+-hydroxamate transport system substrate-binding protein
MMERITDELGRELLIPASPRRVVSLVPSLTEWLFAIGAEEHVVGVTDFCLHPAEGVARATRVRGTKNPDCAAIVAVQPDLVIASREENRERDVITLAESGVAVYVTDIRTVTGALESLAEIARILDHDSGAAPPLAEMRAALRESPARSHESRRVLTPIWRDPWMAVGGDSYAHDLLAVCGATNVAAALPGRYPRFELRDIARLRPDVILLPSEPYRFSEADLPALHESWDGPVRFVDGELLTWYGPRIPLAIRTFRELLRSPTADD